jgi:hypothetical protein
LCTKRDAQYSADDVADDEAAGDVYSFDFLDGVATRGADVEQEDGLA